MKVGLGFGKRISLPWSHEVVKAGLELLLVGVHGFLNLDSMYGLASLQSVTTKVAVHTPLLFS